MRAGVRKSNPGASATRRTMVGTLHRHGFDVPAPPNRWAGVLGRQHLPSPCAPCVRRHGRQHVLQQDGVRLEAADIAPAGRTPPVLLVGAPSGPVVSEHPEPRFGACPQKECDDEAEQVAGRAYPQVSIDVPSSAGRIRSSRRTRQALHRCRWPRRPRSRDRRARRAIEQGSAPARTGAGPAGTQRP